MEQGSSDAGGQDDVVVPEEIGRAQGTQGGDNMDTGSVGEVEEAGEERERGGVEYIAESERERARVAREQEELVATAMAQQQARAMRRSADRNKEVELKPGDRVWVKTRSTKRNSKREFWEGPETVIERRGDIVVVTGAEREQTLAISKLRRAGGNLREGGEISEIVDHQPYQPGLNLDRYKLKVRLVGDKNVHWRQASELVDHVLFHRYALDFQDLTHLIEEEAEGC
jgi:hypothetical protein